MADPCVGEIRIFAGNYAPENWHLCDGTLLGVTANTQLYSLIGNAYGGTAGVDFALPDLRSRVPIHVGTGPTLTPRSLAQTGGSEIVTLSVAEMPTHTHSIFANPVTGSIGNPVGAMFAITHNIFPPAVDSRYLKPGQTIKSTYTLADDALLPDGGGQAHENRMTSVALNYIICLVGLYPNFN